MGSQARARHRLLKKHRAPVTEGELVPKKVIATLSLPHSAEARRCFDFELQRQIDHFGNAYIEISKAPDGKHTRWELRGRELPSFCPLDATPNETPTSANTNIP